MPIIVSEIKTPLSAKKEEIISQAIKKAGLKNSDVVSSAINKTSLDARHNDGIKLVSSVCLTLSSEKLECQVSEKKGFKYYEEKEVDFKILNNILTKEPFAVMITGIDERVKPEEYKKARNDVNILMVVNPQMKHVLTVSFPRDSYIKNACTGYNDKLTHFGMKGTEAARYQVNAIV